MLDSSQQILVIEDEPAVALSLKGYLEDLGFAVSVADGGRRGLEAIRNLSPAAVFLDLRLPELDGLDVLRTASAEFPELPVIVISGKGGISDAVSALRLHAWDYLQKPVCDMEMITRALTRALERARLLQENRRHREGLEAAVHRRTKELELANHSLLRKQDALEEVLNTIQKHKEALNRSIAENVEKMILPLFASLRQSAGPEQRQTLNQLEVAIREVTSPFMGNTKAAFTSLTPVELRICAFIRKGLGVKEIAALEGSSIFTISTHRKHIRRKLGLAHRKANLTTHLQSLDDSSI